jgi:8-oxo-dGTP pyrophosphatase MutT (NUDIX family)
MVNVALVRRSAVDRAIALSPSSPIDVSASATGIDGTGRLRQRAFRARAVWDDGAMPAQASDPVTIRPAATVIVARPASSSVEVLVARRSMASRFAPGFVVFPGGAVDRGDDELATRWFGTPDERARACAVRELAEEAGLAATRAGVVTASDGLGGSWFRPPSIEHLPEIGHWVAPEFMPVRFDARFFAVGCDREVEPTVDGVEVDAAWWERPADLLADHRSGAIPLAWPTLKTLEALAGCRNVAEVLALRVEQVGPPVARPAVSQ